MESVLIIPSLCTLVTFTSTSYLVPYFWYFLHGCLPCRSWCSFHYTFCFMNFVSMVSILSLPIVSLWSHYLPLEENGVRKQRQNVEQNVQLYHFLVMLLLREGGILL